MIGDPASPTVTISDAALDLIAREATMSFDGLETGGILLGTDERERIDIRHAGGPGPNARREPRNFLRDRDYAQTLADTAWQEDSSQWLGEWHTHPSSELVPSGLDLTSYLRHLEDPDLRLHRFISIIVGLDNTGTISAVTWLIEPNQARPLPLRTTSD